MPENSILKGDAFEDDRGILRFVNSFDMTEIVRFYEIEQKGTQIIRGWQGHKLEKKWFYCLSGSFVINIVEIDDFSNPSEHLIPCRIELDSKSPEILAVHNGFATGIKASTSNSRLLVFSNFGLKDSSNDDFRFPKEKWSAVW
ncbi:WxcM-like domain-containing protein [Flagellimonas pacifica]|uniref:WxcM-like, C-terminal n=1 Tax=Flagellimonas pacifica TaxID=1247520 RepID=A0A285MR27_9FLAO|nr:WxcM-like domain-containing protein [Allomuricauda parva]SNY99639.1 WxcM-like, C-terminal [Allomuricauda parva]